MAALLAGLASGGGAPKLYSNDVFSAYTYQGNGSTQTIVNGIDLAGKGGMVWIKGRTNPGGVLGLHNVLTDTLRGASKSVFSNLTDAETSLSAITSFGAAGFTLSNYGDTNYSSATFASWTFANAPKFFQVLSITKSSGSNAAVDLSSLGTVGMVRVKRTDASGSWYVWHRSLSAGKLLIGETTAAEATLGHITVVGTTLTLVDGVISNGDYHIEAYAHDTGADGLIQCGSFTSSSLVNLGWEPQFVQIKRLDSVTAGDWYMIDSMRGFIEVTGTSTALRANSSAAESGIATGPSATGFMPSGLVFPGTYIYCAIRRPNKPPTSGTQVYNAIARTGTGAAATVTGVGFAPDIILSHDRAVGSPTGWWDRLRGITKELESSNTNAEAADSDGLTGFDVMDGARFGAGTITNNINTSGRSYINHFFRRAPKFMDVVCYTGTGVAHAEAHGLGVVPELMIVKNRSVLQTENWYVPVIPGTTSCLFLNTSAALGFANYWPTRPTAAGFTPNGSGDTNFSGQTYVAYLFASKPGISCVTSFIGNGTSQNIDCGFATGARFVMIKATSTTGNWNIGDSTRGIVAGNDPLLCLNTTAAEVTTDDWLDPYAAGFTVNETASAHANTNGVSYLVLAIA